ncbi:diaminopimelate decarboxylase [Plantactinospora sp. S1510]|uniref:Diaminopimelate decarboxylase n=1 Tax=Plantactinospora alkalitolerans TaxID=2789879 RepID=A0ABS0H296_9ACTN|nr:diaminopimelate decarboxylase [Plantactinospora alkalitolerans]MBF9132353.1 diaminopimelate decarboxylase [Plantactinospora alkalitolerans]
MTLSDIIPSLRSSLRAPLTEVWPATAAWGERGDLTIGGVAMTAVVARHGTPTYVLDEADVRQRCRDYLTAFGPDGVAYTAKALLSRGIVRWLAAEGLRLYVGSAGELRVALAAGFPSDRIVLYGSAKTPEDLEAAYTGRVGTIVVESLGEITRLAATAPQGQRVLLRVLGSAEPAEGTDCRFGLRIDSGEAAAAVARIVAQPRLSLVGVDCSVGHQVSRFSVYEREVRGVLEFLAEMRTRHGVEPAEFNLGGGHAVAYSGGDPSLALAAFAGRIRSVLRLAADRHDVPVPRLTVSPGRAIVSRAGITLYHVVSVNRGPDGHLLVAVDGGMTDCPSGALCGGRHSAVLFGRTTCAEPVRATVVGRHNDADDVIVPALTLPADVHPGDLLAVAGSGAYHHSRASNYHLVGRPPLLSARDGRISTLVRRESSDDMLLRDVDEREAA